MEVQKYEAVDHVIDSSVVEGRVLEMVLSSQVNQVLNIHKYLWLPRSGSIVADVQVEIV